MSAPTIVLDVDGTLVDTNYQHAIAWHRAFRDHGYRVAIWDRRLDLGREGGDGGRRTDPGAPHRRFRGGRAAAGTGGR